ncbi:MAG TPA: thiamine-phosphate kinase [Tepidisphaeraceae bacterium]|nr:thiamine-phosphate kinase [Tepidisphaeraceae bacterium]
MPGEFDFIDWVRKQSLASPRLLVPPGDDLAALRWDASDLLLVGADQVLDGVHFDSARHAPRDIGRKVMNRNLSDCAAMACLPAAAVATAALPRDTPLEFVKEIYRGMSASGATFDCPVVGGDTGAWDGKLVLTVTILGRSAGIAPVTRSGARAGDGIWVTGPLGGSILGRHMTFTPRVTLARELAPRGITAMIDISDGLSRDLGHICAQSNVGAIIEAERIPIHEDVMKLPPDGRSPLEHALHDGEDHELLFTAPGDFAGTATRIGTVTADREIWLRGADGTRAPLERKGWEHALA